ncbi:uncharacterized protein L3040_000118 [Drepanopeziza brunnea f. sp. 'multigermtubi']|uniref:uncharacterized protein n=1 Tax=Drepanopeziza brunnea f. sp. 'multigermtubi' TaxID=698441 RepID=UPI0023829479|nr:hypothetical protein L3040_000118 [Drepanopeziza brunnea f. sp. 'multigermtubi']
MVIKARPPNPLECPTARYFTTDLPGQRRSICSRTPAEDLPSANTVASRSTAARMQIVFQKVVIPYGQRSLILRPLGSVIRRLDEGAWSLVDLVSVFFFIG